MNNEKTNFSKYIIFAVIIIAAILFCRSCLHNDGTGIDAIGNQLEEAGRNQQSIADGIDNAQKSTDVIQDSIDESRSGIENAEQSIDRIETDQRTAAGIIADCQRILEGIRKRNESKK